VCSAGYDIPAELARQFFPQFLVGVMMLDAAIPARLKVLPGEVQATQI
jgi:hypothetical protein